MNTITDIGLTVVALRTALGWSQEALAAAANINVRTIQRIESGQPGAIEAVAAISRAFGLQGVQDIQDLRDGLDRLSRVMPIPAVRTGKDVIRLVNGAHGHIVDLPATEDAIREAAEVLIQNAIDWNDIGLEPAMMFDAERSLHENLQALEAAGGRLFCFRRPYESDFKDRKGQPITMDTVVFVVHSKTHPAIQRDDDGRDVLMTLRDKKDTYQIRV